MLGGFNTVKHENHHYKYAHCETDNDMMVVNPDGVFIYTNWYGRTSRVRDLTVDGDFSYVLPNLKKITVNSLGEGFFALVYSDYFKKDMPNLTGAHRLAKNCQSRIIDFSMEKVVDISLCFANCNNLEQLILYAPNATNHNLLCDGCTKLTTFNGDLSKSTTLNNAFNKCNLNKKSTILILNSVPSYTSGTHPLTIGICGDLSGDEEILEAITNAKNKGWTITTQWNGKITKDEVINPEKIAKLDLDSITLPYGYRRCEYLESDINNQYIDTEIVPTNTTGTWIIAKRITETVDGIPLAVRTDSNYYYPPVLRLMGNFHGWGTTTEWTDFTKQNTAFESYINYPINGTITKEAVAINNSGTIVTKELTTELPTISHSIYIFGRNYNGTLERPWNGRIYRAKISEGDQTIKDFIPALDPDGKPCMYEIVEGKPYYNAATSGDDFLYKVYEDYVMPTIDLTTLNIVEGSDYIPDASGWNEIATAKLTEAEEKIVRVVNGVAYNE
jgi:hypothetical protein